LEENLREVVRDHTAGDPAREDVVWTYLSPPEIAEELETRGTPVCADTVRDLLGELGFVQRKAQKRLSMGATPFRNEQFENIARLKAEYLDSDNPILSMDTKKKEHLGNFCRGGKLYTTGVIATSDHDFSGNSACEFVGNKHSWLVVLFLSSCYTQGEVVARDRTATGAGGAGLLDALPPTLSPRRFSTNRSDHPASFGIGTLADPNGKHRFGRLS